jgi:hypothetical protein
MSNASIPTRISVNSLEESLPGFDLSGRMGVGYSVGCDRKRSSSYQKLNARTVAKVSALGGRMERSHVNESAPCSFKSLLTSQSGSAPRSVGGARSLTKPYLYASFKHSACVANVCAARVITAARESMTSQRQRPARSWKIRQGIVAPPLLIGQMVPLAASKHQAERICRTKGIGRCAVR